MSRLTRKGSFESHYNVCHQMMYPLGSCTTSRKWPNCLISNGSPLVVICHDVYSKADRRSHGSQIELLSAYALPVVFRIRVLSAEAGQSCVS